MKGILAICVVALVAAASAVQCPPEQAVDWNLELLLPHEDCDKFYKCALGKPVAQDCPVGLYYSKELQQCDWRENVDCGNRNVDAEQVQPARLLRGLIESVAGAEERRPRPPSSKPQPPKPQPPKPKPQPPRPKPIEFLENGCPVKPQIYWLLPSEEDCNQFYYCVLGEKQIRQCPDSLHFNAELQVCDYPDNAGCQDI